MAHSYIMAHNTEREGFDTFVALFPQMSTLLADTYDAVRGIENAARVASALKQKGQRLQAIRLDGGDLADLSIRARRILDQNGLTEVAILASGNLDEYRINDLLRAGAPIDAFGVGTELVTGGDAPSLEVGYKLAEYGGVPRLKTSQGKLSLPGRKQIFRAVNASGGFYADLIGLSDEGAVTVAREFKPAPSEVSPMLTLQMAAGHRVEPRATLAESRERLLHALGRLDQRHKDLLRPDVYPVRNTAALSAMLTSEKIRAERRQTST
jgi:nicotinate phosphoribosyltransferase